MRKQQIVVIVQTQIPLLSATYFTLAIYFITKLAR